MRCFYDFHIHTALSPCSNDDMTPNNIINMARLKGLNAIAITDHNSIGNVKSAMAVGEKAGITVIAGMEIETAEEVHILALFPELENASEAEKIVKDSLPKINNNETIFGNQFVFDEDDNIVGSEKQMLITATSLNIYETYDLVKKFGGIAVPAHIDRSSYSVISNLGFIPKDLPFRTVEISSNVEDVSLYVAKQNLGGYNVIINSDSHNLWSISEKNYYIEVFDNSAIKILQKFI